MIVDEKIITAAVERLDKILINQSIDVSDAIRKKAIIVVVQRVDISKEEEDPEQVFLKLLESTPEGVNRLESLEERFILSALRRFSYRQDVCTRWLGISSRVLNYKMSQSRLLSQLRPRKLKK